MHQMPFNCERLSCYTVNKDNYNTVTIINTISFRHFLHHMAHYMSSIVNAHQAVRKERRSMLLEAKLILLESTVQRAYVMLQKLPKMNAGRWEVEALV